MSAPRPPHKPDPMTFDEIVRLAESRKLQKPPRRCGWLCRIFRLVLLLLLVVLCGIGGGTYWLLNSEGGLRFALFELPQKLQSGVNIQSQTLRGTLWSGFSGEGWRIETESADIALSRLNFEWQPRQLWDKHLLINKLAVGDIHIDNKPVPPKPDDTDKPRLPDSISLPFGVTLEQLEIGQITQGKAATVLLRGAEGRYRYDHNAHMLELKSVRSPWSDSHGSLKLNTVRPFALEGVMNSTGELDGIAIENIVNLTGSLQDVRLKTDLSGNGVSLHADTYVHPFADSLGKMIDHIDLKGRGINPRAFLSNLPQANLDFDANIRPDLDQATRGLDGSIQLENHSPLPADRNGIPVRTLQGSFAVNESGAVDLHELQADLMKQGSLKLSGGIYAAKRTLNLQAELAKLTAADLLADNIQGSLNGRIHATGTFDAPQAAFEVDTGFARASGNVKLLTDKNIGQRTVWLESGEILPQNGGKLKLSGSLALFKQQKLQARIESETFNPHKLYPALPEGSLNGQVRLDGELANQAFDAELRFTPSTLSGAALSAQGKVSYRDRHLSHADLSVRLGNNELLTQGSFGKKGNTLVVNLNAPQLKQFGFGIDGLLQAKGAVRNTADSWTQIEAVMAGQVRGLNIPNALSIGTLDFKINGTPEPEKPLGIQLIGQNIRSGGTDIDDIRLQLDGTLRRHRLNGAGSLKIDNKPLRVNLAADGGLTAQNQWHGTVAALDAAGALNLRLNTPVRLEAGAERVVLGAARWQALGGNLNIDRFMWDKQQGLSTKGNADSLHFSQLHNFYTPPVQHNLVLAGDWDLSYSQSPRGYLNLRQQGGDITLPTGRTPHLGLSGFVLKTDIGARGILSRFSGDTRYGKASGNFDILQAFGNGALANAPVSGNVRLEVAELNNLRNLLPTGQTVKGSLLGEVRIGGLLNAPQMQGSISGSNLYYRNRDVNIVLQDGTLQSRLQDRRWIVDALTFRQDKGTVTLSGSADYTRDNPDIGADIVFDRYPVLDQPNRRLRVSGKGRLSYNGSLFALDGRLKTEEGRFGFQESSTPTLSDDVVVIGEQKKEPSAATPFKLNLVFDLNDRFHFSGAGLNVTLGGLLTLRAQPGENIQGVGSVNIVKGRYKAYGQDLLIQKGVISFVGPLERPNLNIRAERRNSPVGAGVEVLGNVQSPRVNLVANQPMSEKDKLSWLILNRASSGSSTDEAALSTAAGAFLAGSLNDKIGLVDNFGLTSQQTRNAQTGEMNPAQQVLTFGKQLTQDLYLGYEAGLGNASQSVKLVYQLTRSFQGILRAGTESSGGEIKYQKRFD